MGRRRSVDAVSELHVIRAGLVPYQDAWRIQRELHEARVADTAPDTVLLLQHPPVYTAGKRTEPWERPLDGAPVIDGRSRREDHLARPGATRRLSDREAPPPA